MARILMVGAVMNGNVLLSLDDPTVWTDEGTAYSAYAVTNPVNFGRAAPSGRLRRITQAVTLGADASVTLTPLGDGDEYTEQAHTEALAVADGSTHLVESEPAVDGQRFQYIMAASGFGGPLAFGEADVELIEKRTG